MNKYLNFFLLYKSRNIVSGDFYWFERSPRTLTLVAGDCTGHGVPGAFMTILGVNALRQALNEHLSSPGVILQRVHLFIHKALQQERTENNDGMELAICVIPHKTPNTIAYAGANLPLYYVEPTEEIGKPSVFHKILPERKGVGGYTRREISHKRSYQTHVLDIKPDSTFYLCSDGYQDQFGGKRGKKFMRRRLELQLYENAYLPLKAQKKVHEEKLKQWMDGYKQVDDILLLGFRMKQGQSAKIETN